MTWEQLRTEVYYIDGSWRDIYVLDTTREDWQRWIDYVNHHYPVRWGAGDKDDGKAFDAIDADYITRRWDASIWATWGNIFLEKVQLNCHFFTETQIENDIDPSKIVSIEDHDRLMAYLVAISIALGKEVILTAENSQKAVNIRVNGSDIQFS